MILSFQKLHFPRPRPVKRPSGRERGGGLIARQSKVYLSRSWEPRCTRLSGRRWKAPPAVAQADDSSVFCSPFCCDATRGTAACSSGSITPAGFPAGSANARSATAFRSHRGSIERRRRAIGAAASAPSAEHSADGHTMAIGRAANPAAVGTSTCAADFAAVDAPTGATESAAASAANRPSGATRTWHRDYGSHVQPTAASRCNAFSISSPEHASP